ncbi:MAG TPA: hypothetical protein VKG86_10665 [Terracidiphilus sp.]|nr:hypothetical protein [Terracidiphilus sp.]
MNDPRIENAALATSYQRIQPSFVSLAVKTAVCHTITYFIMGALAYHFLNYAELMARPCSGMRPITDPLVRAGVLFQPLRGVLFALVFYPLRERLFGVKNGWLLMGWMLFALGILGTFAAPPGSMEGLIYTTVPLADQFRGYLEIVTQALLLSALLCYWVNHTGKKWLNWSLSVVFCLGIALSTMALLMPQR